MGELENDAVTVRDLREGDLDAIVRIERKSTGLARGEYYRLKIAAALRETGVRVSLVAETDGYAVGFLMGQVFYGEFGRPEPVAIIDSLGVHPDFRGKGVAHALFRQLRMNLRALRIEKIQTQVDWKEFDLQRFFAREGFAPAPRLCLECVIPPAEAEAQ